MITRGNHDSGSETDDIELLIKKSEHAEVSSQQSSTEFLIRHYSIFMYFLLPALWTCAFVYLVDLDTMLSLWYMPLLGFFAAIIANCVPIGGGVVYIPALYFLGENMELGVAFTVATMSVGSGVIGFMNWLVIDKHLIIWSSIPFTVLPAWLGFICSIALPPMSEDVGMYFFSSFCIALSIFVFAVARVGGAVEFSQQFSGCSSLPSPVYWSITTFISFLSGLILIPNIGIGPALTTFICLSLHGTIDTHAALVTGIVVGGWASWIPLAIHMCIIDDVPFTRWVMVLPGVYLGAWVSIDIVNY